MRLALTDFDPAKHLDAAASLLADRHHRDRDRDPRLPGLFEDAVACRSQVEQALASSDHVGVIAEAEGEYVGYAIMSAQYFESTHMLANFFPPRGGSLVYAGHAVRDGLEYDAYREMYMALAEQFVRRGIFEHSVNLPARDAATIDAFNSLGFGRTQCCAVRDVDPVSGVTSSPELHQAAAEDYAEIERLAEQLTLHHTRSPIFNPYLRESDDANHGFVKGLLQDPKANAHWVAYENGRALGMNTFMQPFFLSPMTVPEKTIYLFLGVVDEDARQGGIGTAILSRGVQWARDEQYHHIALHFATANVSGAKFWQGQGFKPVDFGMRRRIDERIAWANR